MALIPDGGVIEDADAHEVQKHPLPEVAPRGRGDARIAGRAPPG